MAIPPHIKAKLSKPLVQTTTRQDLFAGYRRMQQQFEAMKKAMVNLQARVKRLEGGDSPDSGDSP